jgi:ApbE superfamily uncharacterized protein (UPF0280 family)
LGLLDRIRPAPLMRLGVEAGGYRLQLQLPEAMADEGRASVLRRWEQIESYLVRNPTFKDADGPVLTDEDAPPLIGLMEEASRAVGVAPLDAMSGALVEAVGRDIQLAAKEGTISCEGVSFIIGGGSRTFVVDSTADEEGRAIGLQIDYPDSFAVFTSVGRMRRPQPSGRARAVAVVATDGALAEAVGTAMGKALRRANLLKGVLEVAGRVPSVMGGIVLLDKHIGVWGGIEVVTPPANTR